MRPCGSSSAEALPGGPAPPYSDPVPSTRPTQPQDSAPASDVTEDGARVNERDGVPFAPQDEALAIASRLADRWAGVLERLGR